MSNPTTKDDTPIFMLKLFLMAFGLILVTFLVLSWAPYEGEECEKAGGTFFEDRMGRNVCLAPGITLPERQ
jgi:hypothetical protein